VSCERATGSVEYAGGVCTLNAPIEGTMRRLRLVSIAVAALVAGVGVARGGEAGVGKRVGVEDTPDTCRDGVDNDNNGLLDCEDPKCQGIAGCGPAPWMLPRARRLTPTTQMAAGGLVLGIGAALAGAGVAVLTEAAGSRDYAGRTVSFVAGGLTGAAGLGIALAGALTIRRGMIRRGEEQAMGLDLSLAPRLHLEPLFAVGVGAGFGGVRLRF
jgi:hypothetical protein